MHVQRSGQPEGARSQRNSLQAPAERSTNQSQSRSPRTAAKTPTLRQRSLSEEELFSRRAASSADDSSDPAIKTPRLEKRDCPDGTSPRPVSREAGYPDPAEKLVARYTPYLVPFDATGAMHELKLRAVLLFKPEIQSAFDEIPLDLWCTLCRWTASARQLLQDHAAGRIRGACGDGVGRYGLVAQSKALGRALVPKLSRSETLATRFGGGSVSTAAAERALAAFPPEAKERLAAGVRVAVATSLRGGVPVGEMEIREVLATMLLGCLIQQLKAQLLLSCNEGAAEADIPLAVTRLESCLRGFFGMPGGDSSSHEGVTAAQLPPRERARGTKFFNGLVDEVMRMSEDPVLFDDDVF